MLTFEPMLNFYNLYEFMNMISWCSEQSQNNDNPEFAAGRNIHTLKFTFPCNMTNRDDIERIRLFGTGGKLLAALKRLMSNLKKLKRLELIDLMLDPKEAQFLLDEVCEGCCLTLQTLSVINTTRVQYELFHVGVFLNLKVLYISPQNLGDDVIELLSHTNIEHIHILQNRYTPNDINIKPVSYKTWKTARKNNPNLKVHLQLESVKEKAIIWQQGAPVSTVLYDSPHIKLRTDHLMTVIEFYKSTLRIFGHKNIPRFYRSKSFHERVDGSLMLLTRQCFYLTTLVRTT
jgi:F-box protein 39